MSDGIIHYEIDWYINKQTITYLFDISFLFDIVYDRGLEHLPYQSNVQAPYGIREVSHRLSHLLD
jgi:hypothetical protein